VRPNGGFTMDGDEDNEGFQEWEYGETGYEAGRCTLTPTDPQLKGAWYPGGFNPRTYQVKPRFQNVPFKFNLYRYDEAQFDEEGTLKVGDTGGGGRGLSLTCLRSSTCLSRLISAILKPLYYR
jgi:hypothetical protein